MPPHSSTTEPTAESRREPITVLWVGDDSLTRERIAETRGGDSRLEIRPAESTAAALDALDGVDCVVEERDRREAEGIELVEALQEREPPLPLVLVTSGARREVSEPILQATWADHFHRETDATSAALLERRIARLVDHRRLSTLAERGLTALETIRDGAAIVGVDGSFEFVNQVFALQFGFDRNALAGRPWQTVYTDAAVDRLESQALPMVENGWQWTGSCVGNGTSGTFTARTTIAGLDGGGFVLVVHEEDHSSGER
ncbi:PAS sensor protein [Natronococcus pandeyae]|uniref:PAS sensor protein n=1 Tax=Natronococcus pandeyae TaxID=2055836 RepID=A0A8J8Q5Q9_9EURY|nr:PAS domain-containing protein [Natronococcus pandeyae]TYL39557.1 PAS sensor protein [Natronococcus pandeyae]